MALACNYKLKMTAFMVLRLPPSLPPLLQYTLLVMLSIIQCMIIKTWKVVQNK